jgi:hypothetical protein
MLDKLNTEEETPHYLPTEVKMAEAKTVAPKRGDRVDSTDHQGTFEVVAVNSLMQTANLRAVDGSGPVIPNVPWTALKAVGKK